jgi:hypothetical protein
VTIVNNDKEAEDEYTWTKGEVQAPAYRCVLLEYGVSINGLSALGLIYHHNNILIIRDHQLSDDP